MSDQNILKEIAQAEQDYSDALKKLALAKKTWVAIETTVIDTKIALERAKEKLRTYRNTTPNYVVVEQREQEIEEFRVRYPELVEEAKERDLQDK